MWRILSILTSSVLIFNCCYNDLSYSEKEGNFIPEPLTVQVRIELPANEHHYSRIVLNEDMINTIELLVFEDGGYKYKTSGYSINNDSKAAFFNAKLYTSNKNVKILFLANSLGLSSVSPSPGDTEEQVRKLYYQEFEGNIDGYIPMSGEYSLPKGLTALQNNIINGITMVRSIAQVDIHLDDVVQDYFQLKTIQVFHAHEMMSLIPNQFTGTSVKSPTIPDQSVASVNTLPLDIIGNISEKQVYIPESAVVSDPVNRMKEATCVVVGGIYRNDNRITYYRMDFNPYDENSGFGQVLRNHRYVFKIKGVASSGWEIADSATNNYSSSVRFEIKEWDENTHNMEFDGKNYFGVNTRSIDLKYTEGSQGKFMVDTDVAHYTIEWADENGKGIGRAAGPGEVVFNDLFEAFLASDGKSIEITALNRNEGDVTLTSMLLVKAKRLEIRLTINQLIRELNISPVYVYGTAYEIGRFGDELLGTTEDYAKADRPKSLREFLKNETYFGYQGIVHCGGIFFGGLNNGGNRYDFTSAIISMFDVLYLTYAGTSNANTASIALKWLDAKNNRVMIVQYDNTEMNSAGISNWNIMKALGVDAAKKSSMSLYSLSPEAPEEIINGPFGNLSSDSSIRCYDTTHGEISLDATRRSNIIPILIGGDGGVVLGIDMQRKIIYSGDIDIYYSAHGGSGGDRISENGNYDPANAADILMGNLWAWIVEKVLYE